MSKKYKFSSNDKLHFVTFTVTNWIDLFIRNEYREIIIDSIQFCQKEKDLDVYGWCIMTSHVHLMIGTRGNSLSNIMRDLKRHSSEMLHKAIAKNQKESRKEWILWMMERAGLKASNNAKFPRLIGRAGVMATRKSSTGIINIANGSSKIRLLALQSNRSRFCNTCGRLEI